MNTQTPVVETPVVETPVELAPETKDERTWSEDIELAGNQLVEIYCVTCNLY